jgi:cytochrome c oxidase subunit II
MTFSGSFAILPGDLGFSEFFLAITFFVIAGGVVIFLGIVVWSTRNPDKTKQYAMERHEKTYSILFLIIVLVFASSTLGLLPYPYAHPGLTPTMTVNVRAQQFQWCLAYYPNWGTNCQPIMVIPVGNVVLFNTSSIDVNHDFGLYSASGQLLDQVQVMPGYYNNIIYQFTKPGIYYVRCLEFCGWGHFGMVSEINVTV